VLESWEERGLMGIGRGREREASVCLGEFLEGSGVDGLWRMFFFWFVNIIKNGNYLVF
jgi:hypothetical protein